MQNSRNRSSEGGSSGMRCIDVVCGMRCIDLCNEAIKILGTHFSYNSRIKEECNFLKIVSNVQSVLNLWRHRNLTLAGRIVAFKSLAISKIVFQALIASVPTHITKALEAIQTSFLWSNPNPKIKHKTLCKRYENGGLKNVDIRNNVNSLQSSWVKRLYNDFFHEGKFIPLYQLNKTFCPSFKFHSCSSSELQKIIFDYSDFNKNDLSQNHHVIKGARILPLDKLSSKQIYSILISNIVNKPISNILF